MKRCEISILMCSWNSPNLLSVCVPNILRSLSLDVRLFVCLNEGDTESRAILSDYKIPYVNLPFNSGALGVDYLSQFINSEYVVNTNDDMLFHKGWDIDLKKIIEECYPCSSACFLVEPRYTGYSPILAIDNLGEFNSNAEQAFLKNFEAGKYKNKRRISYNHPIMVKTSDYYKVGGYSDGFDYNWFPGYGLDDYFCYRLWKAHDEKFRCITSGDSCVYHGMSLTTAKMPQEVKNRNGLAYFASRTGISIQQFRQRINHFQEV